MRLIEKSLMMLGEFFDFIIAACALLLALTAAALAFA